MPFWVIPAITAAASLVSSWLGSRAAKKGAEKQAKSNKELAAFQAAENEKLLKTQLGYDAPAAQRQRMIDAGYNPNLFYGQGSAGNQGAPLKYPDIQQADFQGSSNMLGGAIMGFLQQYQQSRLLAAQTDLTKNKVNESTVKQDLNKAQTDLIKANPYFKPGYVDSIVRNLRSVADLKEQERDFMFEVPTGDATKRPELRGSQTIGYIKMDKELQRLFQQFDLGQQDKKVKAEIIQGKEFQNALQKIQVDWMKDGDITPQHIYMGIMMLLQKMM